MVEFNQDVPGCFCESVRIFYFFGDNQDYDAQGNVKKGKDFEAEFSTKVLGSEFRVNAQLINEILEIEAGEGDT